MVTCHENQDVNAATYRCVLFRALVVEWQVIDAKQEDWQSEELDKDVFEVKASQEAQLKLLTMKRQQPTCVRLFRSDNGIIPLSPICHSQPMNIMARTANYASLQQIVFIPTNAG